MLQNKKFYVVLILVVIFILLGIQTNANAKNEINRKYNVRNWGVDPFISHLDMVERRREKKIHKREQKKQKVDRESQIANEIEGKIKISGVLKGQTNLAIINGEVYEEGEVILGKKITDIEPEYIVLEQAGYEFKKSVYENQYK